MQLVLLGLGVLSEWSQSWFVQESIINHKTQLCCCRFLSLAASAKSREVRLRCSHNNIHQIRVRTLKMSAITILTFVACWTPYYLLGLWYWFSPEMLTREQVPPSLSHVFFLFGLLSTCLDPLVYCFCSSRHRTDKKLAKASSVHMTSEWASTVSNGPMAEPGVHWVCKPGCALSPKLAWARKEKMAESCI